MNRSAYLAAPLLLTLSACVTGGNIKGDFQCKAPGGTCAPMSSIDAAAIASIGSFRSVSDPGIDTPTVPRGVAGPVLADGSAPPRTSDRVLRVVFPAHIDSDGIYREESAAHAVVENAAWADALGARSTPKRGVSALRQAGILPASSPGSALATMDEIIAARAANASSPVAALPAGSANVSAAPSMPEAPPVSAARSFEMRSRSAAPMSLAEVASGLTAPRLSALDPRVAPTNYDTPDVTAVRQPAVATVSGPAVAVRASKSSTVSAAAPYGTRTVRWKGRNYQVPYKTPQPGTSAVAAAPSSATADLNKAALASVKRATPSDSTVSWKRSLSSPAPSASVAGAGANKADDKAVVTSAVADPKPTYGPTTDVGEAQARVKAMAAPVLLGAMDQGKAAARDAAPQGFALPLPSKDMPR